jgi:SAM-dependent methyltransferase
MVAVAHELAPELDLRVGDGCTLPFAHAVFDAVTCGLSLSHFTEAGQVLTEVRRVLRPAGVLVASAWGRGSSFATRPLPEILDRYTEADDGIDEETWSATEQAVGVLRSAGFTDVTATSERFDGAFVDVSEAVAWFTGWPLVAERISRLDPRRRAAFLSDARAALAAVSLSWTFAFNFYVARRPPE